MLNADLVIGYKDYLKEIDFFEEKFFNPGKSIVLKVKDEHFSLNDEAILINIVALGEYDKELYDYLVKKLNNPINYSSDKILGGITALQVACADGQVEIARYLLENGGDLERGSDNSVNYTALHYAARNGKEKLVNQLFAHALASIKDVHQWLLQVDVKGQTAYDKARKQGHVYAAHYLEKAMKGDLLTMGVDGPNANLSLGQKELLLALGNDLTDSSIDLIKSEMDIDFVDSRGATLLHIAVENNNLDICDALIKSDYIKYLDTVDCSGNTPLILASKFGYTKLVDALLEAGADSEQKDVFGITPLEFTALSRDIDTFDVISSRRATKADIQELQKQVSVQCSSEILLHYVNHITSKLKASWKNEPLEYALGDELVNESLFKLDKNREQLRELLSISTKDLDAELSEYSDIIRDALNILNQHHNEAYEYFKTLFLELRLLTKIFASAQLLESKTPAYEVARLNQSKHIDKLLDQSIVDFINDFRALIPIYNIEYQQVPLQGDNIIKVITNVLGTGLKDSEIASIALNLTDARSREFASRKVYNPANETSINQNSNKSFAQYENQYKQFAFEDSRLLLAVLYIKSNQLIGVENISTIIEGYDLKELEVARTIQITLDEIKNLAFRGDEVKQEILIPLSNAKGDLAWSMGHKTVNTKRLANYTDKHLYEEFDITRRTQEDVNVAQMLYFAMINIGISKGHIVDMDCIIKFKDTHPEIFDRICKKHPQYFMGNDAVIELINDMTIITDASELSGLESKEYTPQSDDSVDVKEITLLSPPRPEEEVNPIGVISESIEEKDIME